MIYASASRALGTGESFGGLILSALDAGDSAGLRIDQMNARASGACHRMISGAVIVWPGVGGMSLDVVAGGRAAIDESGHCSFF
jgi:hypothetical protein